jgi:hypothetical protein
MPRLVLILALALAALTGCQKNPKLGTVAVDLYIHPESSSSDDVMLQTAIRGKLEADAAIAGHVQVRVVDLQAVLTGNVAKKDASDKAEQIARATKVTVDNDKPIVVNKVTNLVKVGD